MKTHDHRYIFSLLYAILAFLSIFVMTSGGLGVSVDSEEYLIMAERFLDGRWMRTFNPIWPPLYPLIMTGISLISSAESIAAARIVNILCYVMLMVAVFPLGMLIQGRFLAHLSSISILFLAPLTYIYSFCWSETLYITLSVWFFLFLTLFIKSASEEQKKYLLLAAVFAGLASITRFVGISLVVTGILSVFLFGRPHPLARKLKRISVFTLFALTPLILYYFLCFLHYGLAGKTQFPSKFTFWNQIACWFSTVYGDFLSFSLSYWNYLFFFRWGNLDYWLRIMVVSGMLLFIAVLVTRLRFWASVKAGWRLQISMLIYLFLYSAIIISTSSIITIDPIGSRFTVPMYPLILILVFINVSSIYRILGSMKAEKWFCVVLFASILSFWGIQVISSLSIFLGIGSGLFPTMEQPGNLQRKSLRFLKEQVKSSEIVITNIPRKLSFIWPRQLRYHDIRKTDWQVSQEYLIHEATKAPVYILICTQDYSPLGITVEDAEETHRVSNLFAWRKDFGNDVIFKTKLVVFRQSSESERGE